EMPDLWQRAVSRWNRLNARHRIRLEEDVVPDRNEEYFLYQTLAGAWPLGSPGPEGHARFPRPADALGGSPPPAPAVRGGSPAGDSGGGNRPEGVGGANFLERIQAYMQKAMHEAKVHTSWINPNPRFDEAIRQFVAAVLDGGRSARFLEDFRAFQARVTHY